MANYKNNTSNFWLDDDYGYDVLTGDYIKPAKDYAKTAATKRAIANFVSIVTGQNQYLLNTILKMIVIQTVSK